MGGQRKKEGNEQEGRRKKILTWYPRILIVLKVKEIKYGKGRSPGEGLIEPCRGGKYAPPHEGEKRIGGDRFWNVILW